MIITQYYKQLEPGHNASPADFVCDEDDLVIGFISEVYENTYDCVLFDPINTDETTIISYSDTINWQQILILLQKALKQNKARMFDWHHYCALPDITEEDEDED